MLSQFCTLMMFSFIFRIIKWSWFKIYLLTFFIPLRFGICNFSREAFCPHATEVCWLLTRVGQCVCALCQMSGLVFRERHFTAVRLSLHSQSLQRRTAGEQLRIPTSQDKRLTLGREKLRLQESSIDLQGQLYHTFSQKLLVFPSHTSLRCWKTSKTAFAIKTLDTLEWFYPKEQGKELNI